METQSTRETIRHLVNTGFTSDRDAHKHTSFKSSVWWRLAFIYPLEKITVTLESVFCVQCISMLISSLSNFKLLYMS